MKKLKLVVNKEKEMSFKQGLLFKMLSLSQMQTQDKSKGFKKKFYLSFLFCFVFFFTAKRPKEIHLEKSSRRPADIMCKRMYLTIGKFS